MEDTVLTTFRKSPDAEADEGVKKGRKTGGIILERPLTGEQQVYIMIIIDAFVSGEL